MEIGSEYELRIEALIETPDNIYKLLDSYSTYYVDSGRSAIRSVLSLIEHGEVLLPTFICDSVILPFNDFEKTFYGIRKDMSIDIEDLSKKINPRTKVVFVMNYFGKIQSDEIINSLRILKDKYRFTIIEDTTHSIFSATNIIGDYCVCSLRKWFPLPDGGVLYSKNNLDGLKTNSIPRKNDIDKTYAMILKSLYLDHRLDTKELYRKLFAESETKLDNRPDIRKISYFSEWLLNFYSIDKLTLVRKENYKYLSTLIKNIGIEPIMNLSENECPFVLPIYIENRDKLRSFLTNYKIYCAIHWAPSNHFDASAVKMSKKIISLPIDQRYGQQEMDYLASVLINHMECNHENNIPK